MPDTNSGYKKLQRATSEAFFFGNGTILPGPCKPFSRASLVASRPRDFKYLFVVVGLLCRKIDWITDPSLISFMINKVVINSHIHSQPIKVNNDNRNLKSECAYIDKG